VLLKVMHTSYVLTLQLTDCYLYSFFVCTLTKIMRKIFFFFENLGKIRFSCRFFVSVLRLQYRLGLVISLNLLLPNFIPFFKYVSNNKRTAPTLWFFLVFEIFKNIYFQKEFGEIFDNKC